MNRLALIILTSCALLAPIRVSWPQTAPPGVNPEVPPGTETPQGDILLQGDAPQPLIPEIQPGTETPRGGDTGMAPGTTVLQPGGGDGTQTEDELYVGRKATGLLPETQAPEVQPGTETPRGGDTGMAPGTAVLQSGGGDGTQTEDELYVGRKATGLLPETPAPEVQPGTETPRGGDTGMAPGTAVLQSGGGDGTQTEDELYVGRKATGLLPETPAPEIQPGTETPRAGDTGMAPGTTVLQSGGGDGTQTEDELYVGSKATGLLPETPAPEIQPGSETPRGGDTGMALGTGPLPGTQNSGDEDDIEDLQVERLTVKGGDMLQDATGVSPAAAPPQLPGQPASGGLDLSAVGMKPKDAGGAGGGEPQPTAKTPRFKAGKVLKDSLNLTGEPTRRENCGTVLTGLIDDPDSDVNPCPTGCERGEQLWVKTYKSGDTTQYEASYQCYMPAIPTLSMPADAPSSGENCGTYWTGWMDTLDTGVDPCPQGCLRGQKPTVKTGLSGHGIKYDVNYQCYMPEIPTLSMPADAPSSGENCGTYWTGWMDTLDTEVNPCPQNCVRGQKPTVKTGLSGHGIKYDVHYQCYTATTTMAADARTPKPIADPAAAPQQVTSTPAGKLIPASGPWGEFVRVEGARFGSAETVRGMWFPADDTTQPPSMSQTVTLRARDGADAIEIQIPADPLTSGWSGDYTKGALRLLLTMPDESVIYAGEYTIDSGDARTNLRNQGDILIKSQPAPLGPVPDQPAISAAQLPSGSPAGLAVGAAQSSLGHAPIDPSQGPTTGPGGLTTAIASPPVSPTPILGGGVAGAAILEPSLENTEAPLATEVKAVSGAPIEMNRPVAADREVSTRNIVTGPTLLAVTGEDATTIKVSWRPLAGASDYKAHAAAKGLDHSVTGQEVRQPVLNGANQPGLPDAITYVLSGLAPGVEHDVWVTVNFPDGQGGTSDLKTVTTKAGENPKNFRAFASATGGSGAVRLEWQAVPGVTHYFVEGSNLPRTSTTNTNFVVPDIRTVGTHEWTVISVYPGGLYDDLNPSRASLEVGGSPVVSDPARYRVTVNGFRVSRQTLDDPLQRDGKGDEVYIAVYVAEHDSRGNQLSSNLIRPPVVFGDKNGFGSGRVSAGSMSGSGGLQNGDSYPGSNPAIRASGLFHSRDLPFVVWQGELATAGNYIVVVPSIWEWDGNSQDFDDWANVMPSGLLVVREQLRQVLQQIDRYPSSGWPGIHLSRPSFSERSAGDRPIGLRASPQGGVHEYFDRAFALNREFIEAKLTTASQTSLPPGVVSTGFEDDPSLSHVLGGDYTLYLQVERLP